MARHDVECGVCGEVIRDLSLCPWPDEDPPHRRVSPPTECAGRMVILWTATGTPHVPACHPSEAIVLWEDPKTGRVAYPGRNDVPMPERYRRDGYLRREIRTLHGIHQFEREQSLKGHGVRSEVAWFDRGTGRGFDE